MSPVSTKTQVSWSPIASWISTAATELIDAAGEAADHPLAADLGADVGDRLVAVGGHGPVADEAGEVGEVLQQAARR